ncbi:hypothetical protein H5T51_02505 [Candidatus Bathyarchaeota archaeon]|nr:hypothetical protein [Candidatus Bathyarchaeota archaeon]
MKVPLALVLFFLAPAIAELLSGSAPPTEFFNPIVFALLASLYGSGALIMRELKVRWRKGYFSLFVLGAAYGVIEEGLMVKSFFDPDWMDLGILGTYGRWHDVNWVWAEWLTIYHAIFSITVPVALVETVYAEKRNERWVGNRTLIALILLLAAVTLLGYAALTPYRPPLPQYLMALLSVAILIIVAWKLPPDMGRTGRMPPPSSAKLAIIGFLFAAGLFMLFMAGPYMIPHPMVLMTMGLLLVGAMALFLGKHRWSQKSLYHKFSLAAGALSFLIALTPIQEFSVNRPDSPRGMLIVGIVSAILLLLLCRKVKREPRGFKH